MKPEVSQRLPDGWSSSSENGERYTILSWPGYGAITIDWTERTYRFGMVWSGRRATEARYEGRSWSQRLFDDAIAALQHDVATYEKTRKKA